MNRKLCYFNIFFPAVYFMLYYRGSTNYLAAAGFVVLIVFSGLFLRQEEKIEFKNNGILTLSAILTTIFWLYQMAGLVSLILATELAYLSSGRAVQVIIAFLFYTLIFFQLVRYVKRISV